MKKEYRGKFGNFVHEERKKEEETLEICEDILKNSRNEMAVAMRFLQSAFGALRPTVSGETDVMGTDGKLLFASPTWLLNTFIQNKVWINRMYLHELLHCLFCHLWNRKVKEESDQRLWNLAADIAVENVMDDLYEKAVYIRPNSFRREKYRQWKEKKNVLTADAMFYLLMECEENEIIRLEQEFRRDDHHFWYTPQNRSGMASHQKEWEEMRRKMQTEIELFSKEAAGDSPGLVEHLQAENRKRYDYREFLRKFSVLKEEMQVDMDSFDPIYYHFGMETYGNMPLIEPLETREVKKVSEFVIVIDTSMSCSGELVQRFLEETYGILSDSGNFFQKVNIHIIQCDEKVHSDVKITGAEELQEYMNSLELYGDGGTDFRPAFAYVEELMEKREFENLKGLVYFTDGYGLFPAKMPPYRTAFVFMEQEPEDVDIPAWAMKLVITEEEL